MRTAAIALGCGLALAAPAAQAPSAPALPVFTDITAQAGIRFVHSYGDREMDNIVEGTGAGVALFDYDGDGWLDIYFVTGVWTKGVNDNRSRDMQGKHRNALYRNNRDGTFEDVTEKAGVAGGGYGVAASAADYDGDGDVDLYLANYGPDILYRNNGDGTFADVTAAAGLGDPRWGVSAPWLDYDNDGDLDLFVANYLLYDDGKFRTYYAAAGYPGPLSYEGQPDALYRNNGDGTFTDVTQAAGLFNPQGRAMSAIASDLNNDGLLDLYVANDAMANDYFENTGKGTFVEKGLLLGLAFGEQGQGVSSMGPVAGDVDGDGRLDIFIPDMGYGSLLMNRGGNFEDRTTGSGLAVLCGQYIGWGGVLFDYDNDADLDLFVANGDAHHEYVEEAVLAANDGKGNFTDVAKLSGPYFREKYVGRGAAPGDLDNDGDLDLVVVNLNAPPKILRNDGGNRGHWLKVEVKQANGTSDAIGARVTVEAAGRRLFDDVSPVRGYLSQADARPHFGLGAAAKADVVEIRWPDRTVQRLTDVPADQILKVVKGSR